MKKIIPIFILGILLAGCQNKNVYVEKLLNYQPNQNITPTMNSQVTPSPTPSEKLSENITATIKTSKGDIVVELYPKQAPITVSNFIGLSKGTKDWTDPKTKSKVSGKSLYSGTIFHRVIPDFMIQGGDPLGQGFGGPGYQFSDEFDSSLTFSEPYMLAMANSGPGTNGSQFFITVAPTTWLNNHHTIFGKVTKGQSVVDAIANTKTDASDKPVTPISITSIEITEK